MIVTFQQKAPASTVFAPGCMDSSIGERCPVTVDGRTVADAVIRGYRLLDNGAAIEVTIEIPDEEPASTSTAPSDPMRLARQHYPDVHIQQMRPEGGAS